MVTKIQEHQVMLVLLVLIVPAAACILTLIDVFYNDGFVSARLPLGLVIFSMYGGCAALPTLPLALFYYVFLDEQKRLEHLNDRSDVRARWTWGVLLLFLVLTILVATFHYFYIVPMD